MVAVDGIGDRQGHLGGAVDVMDAVAGQDLGYAVVVDVGQRERAVAGLVAYPGDGAVVLEGDQLVVGGRGDDLGDAVAVDVTSAGVMVVSISTVLFQCTAPVAPSSTYRWPANCP